MKPLRRIVTAMIACVCILLARCSVSPTVADGGTHTGNPDISACASALAGVAAMGDAWSVGHYVQPGQLDPAGIDPPSSGGLARGLRKASSAVDTIAKYDTTYVNDTLLNEHVQTDTLDTLIGGDTTVFIRSFLVGDSVFVVDTVVDTGYLFVTTGPSDTPAGATPQTSYDVQPAPKLDSAVYNPTDTTVNYLFQNPQSGAVSSVPAARANVTVKNAAALDVLTLCKAFVLPGNARVTVRYSDAGLDGSVLLYGAAGGSSPSAQLIQDTCTAADTAELTAIIDAGADMQFSSTLDNRILRLSRIVRQAGDTTEAVSCTSGVAKSPTDTLSLSIKTFPQGDTVFSSRSMCRFTVGPDGRAGTGNDRLVSVAQSLVYRRGDVDHLDLTLVPQSPLSPIATLGSSHFSATIVMVDKTTTTLDGTFDPATGIVATYVKDGKESQVTVSAAGVVVIH